MNSRTFQSRVLLVITLALLGIVVPYLIAWRISPAGTVFSGFLMNPVDGFSYLAKMRQGFDGSLLFQLPYAQAPGSGTLLFIFYLLLGHVSRLTGIPMILTYHLARVLFSAFYFVLLYTFFGRVFEGARLKWAAFILTLFGSGLGWIGLPVFGRQSIDLWVPEAIPLLSAYTNPHFPLAASLFIGGIMLVFKSGDREWWHWILALLCGFALGAVLPFVTIPLFLVLAVWLGWERLAGSEANTPQWLMQGSLALLLLVLGAGPWLVYDYWVSISHPAISLWNAQNVTPSPPLIDTLLGFGLIVAIALVSLGSRPWREGRTGRLFTVWFVLGVVLLYMPLPFQRRISLGLLIPMAGLSAWWMNNRFKDPGRFRLAQVVILALSLPSILLVMVVGVAGAARGEKAIVFELSELQAYRWIDANVPRGSLFLAEPNYGNRLPAFADVRVLYGHPFETPQAERAEQTVSSLLRWQTDPTQGLLELSQWEIGWVFIRVVPGSASEPTWLRAIRPRAEFREFQVLEIGSP